MSYANFKPIVWSKHIQHELKKHTIFKEDCDYKFSGEAGEGKRVKVLGVGKPTIGDYTGASIGAPETIPDSSVYIDIDQAKFFNFMVDDVDKAQATEGLMAALMEETTRALAEDEDSFLAKQIALGAGKKETKTTAVTTAALAKAAIDGAFVHLWNQGVTFKDKVTIYLTPWFYSLFKDYLIEYKTDNDKLIAKGIVGAYNNAQVKLTNNIYNDGTYDNLIIKTSKGFAYCDGIDKTEAYRPDDLFADAVKGLHTYGGKAVRPKEIYCLKVKEA